MLRELRIDDAKRMYDWMQDTSITKYFDKDFSKYSVLDCENFIHKSILDYNLERPNDINFAITDSTGLYKGTVSLKNINYSLNFAEFAIVLVSESHGSGLAKEAFDDMIKYGFDRLRLDLIFLSCRKDNVIANKFYNKMKATMVNYDILLKRLNGDIKGYDENMISNLLWYIVDKKDISFI